MGNLRRLCQQLAYLTGLTDPGIRMDTSSGGRLRVAALSGDTAAVNVLTEYFVRRELRYGAEQELARKSYLPKVVAGAGGWARGSGDGLGYQRLNYLQTGSTGSNTPPWLVTDTQRYWNLGVGGSWVPQERWTLSLDYLLAPAYDNTDTTVGAAAPQAFPENWTKVQIARLDVAYRWTSALQVHFRYTHETYNSSDWALDSVGPSTLPNLLALGIQAPRANVDLFGLTVRYQFGRNDAQKTE